MLDHAGFDLWADNYDRTVGLSDDDGTYPFAGYRAMLGMIFSRVLSSGAETVLDMGFGTGVLTAKFYERGLVVYGQDFSERMIALAKEKMPQAQLFYGDFSLGLAKPLMERKYDAIIATYSMHHLTDEQKGPLLAGLYSLLEEGGCLYIGDVAFGTRAELEACRLDCGEEWDGDEDYFVYEEVKSLFPAMTFERISHCAGLLCLKR